MAPNFAKSAPKVGAVAEAIEVDFQGEGSWSVSPPQTRHDPDSVMSNARSRIAKLEAVMVAVGESHPTYPGLFNALQKTRALAEVQKVQDRIASTESFIARARKRVETEGKGVESQGGAR